ncbi:MAG: tetratricopeptide repeat protein, partial [Chloroflexi bacterium]|nr:tetratricopeptide repeat protein [Chloroflexota bacterium]
LLINILRRKTSRYLFGSLYIPLALIYNPWTAPILGKLITAVQIWRLSWSFPYALIIGYVLFQLFHSFPIRQYRVNLQEKTDAVITRNSQFDWALGFGTSLMAVTLFVFLIPRIKSGIEYIDVRKGYYLVSPSEIEVGEFFRFDDEEKRTVLTNEITARSLPGITSNINLVRYRQGWPYDPELDRNMNHLFRKAEIIDQAIVDFIGSYNVDYLVLENYLPIQRYFENLPSISYMVFKNADYSIFKINPDLNNSLVVSGDLHYLNGDLWRAEKYYQDALSKNPEDPLAYLGLGRVRIKQGDFSGSIEYFRNAINMAGEDEVMVKLVSEELRIQDEYTTNYVNNPYGYRTPNLYNTVYDFLEQLPNAIKSTVNNPSYIHQAVFLNRSVPFGVLFQHAPSEVTYKLTVPSNSILTFSPVIAPDVWQYGKGDGVQFRVYLTTEEMKQYTVFDSYLDPKNIVSQREIFTKYFDISRWEGQTVEITFSTGCGPNDDCSYDWAGWGEPRITQPVYYDFLEDFASALTSASNGENGHVDVLEQTINYDTRRILYQHPTSRVTYSVSLPERAVLQFGLGMAPEVWTAENSDGAVYNIYVRDPEEPFVTQRVYHRMIDPQNNPDDRRWFNERVDLSAFGGKEVEIIFEALPGPADNYDFDWGGWSSPVIIDETGPGSRAAYATESATITP